MFTPAKTCFVNFVKNTTSLLPFTAKTDIGEPFVELTEVESTNIYAMERVQANMAAHGSAYFAHTQTAGKGQLGKKWLSEPGSNLILSVVLDGSPFLITQLFELSLVVSLACHDFFSGYAGDETSIKWPNDIYWRDRKAGGILIENIIRGEKWIASVVGIGININQTTFPDNLKNPVSLKQITGNVFDSVQLAKELCRHLQFRYSAWVGGEAKKLLAYYNQCLFKKGATVSLKKNNIIFPCTIDSVNAAGDLVVSNGMMQQFQFGEVEWILG
jgi:BirA family biotin operon repressor/biotin-[acetyl-CoA-carboxylase] ligase